LHISTSYAKILEEKIFTREFPRSGSKAKDGEKREERQNDGNKNGQLRIATPPAPKPAWANLILSMFWLGIAASNSVMRKTTRLASLTYNLTSRHKIIKKMMTWG